MLIRHDIQEALEPCTGVAFTSEVKAATEFAVSKKIEMYLYGTNLQMGRDITVSVVCQPWGDAECQILAHTEEAQKFLELNWEDDPGSCSSPSF